jgi:hypothetical protein
MRNVSVKGGTLLLASIDEQPPLERQLARIRKRLSTGLLRPGAQTFLVNIDHLQALTVKTCISFAVGSKPELRLKRIYDKMVPPICFGI